MERKFFISEIKSANDQVLVIEAFISTERPDRMGDIMRADGMKIDGKPTVLFSHGMGSMGQEPIGRPLRIEKGEHNGYKGIKAKIEFYPDETGKRLYRKVKEGYLHSFSIGYLVNESTPIKGGRGRDITDWTLLEMSLVAVPANPDAVTIESGSFSGLQFKFMPQREVTADISEVKSMVREAVQQETSAYGEALKIELRKKRP